MMKVLMVGSQASVSGNLRKGLECRGHTVVVVHTPTPVDEGCPHYSSRWVNPLRKQFGDGFDVVHVHSPNLKRFLMVYPYLRGGVPLVCHWHGSDLRVWYKSMPVKRYMMRKAGMNVYSTVDLAWWLRVPRDRKVLVNCPVDTDVFKPSGVRGSGVVVFDGGGLSGHRVPHGDMPGFLCKYEMVDVHNSMGLDDNLMSVVALEAASCGLVVKQFPWIDRRWVEENASVGVVGQQMEELYRVVVGE